MPLSFETYESACLVAEQVASYVQTAQVVPIDDRFVVFTEVRLPSSTVVSVFGEDGSKDVAYRNYDTTSPSGQVSVGGQVICTYPIAQEYAKSKWIDLLAGDSFTWCVLLEKDTPLMNSEFVQSALTTEVEEDSDVYVTSEKIRPRIKKVDKVYLVETQDAFYIHGQDVPDYPTYIVRTTRVPRIHRLRMALAKAVYKGKYEYKRFNRIFHNISWELARRFIILPVMQSDDQEGEDEEGNTWAESMEIGVGFISFLYACYNSYDNKKLLTATVISYMCANKLATKAYQLILDYINGPVMQNDDIAEAVIGLSTIAAASISLIGDPKGNVKIPDIIKAGSKCKAISAINSTGHLVKTVVNNAKQICWTSYTGLGFEYYEHPLFLAKYTAWHTEAIYYMYNANANLSIISSAASRNKLIELYEIGIGLESESLLVKELKELHSEIVKINRSMSKQMEAVRGQAFEPENKPECVVILLQGKPGIGKSSTVTSLISEIAKKTYTPKQLLDDGVTKFNQLIYTSAAGSVFMDGYKNQKFIQLDEFAQRKDTDPELVQEILRFMAMVNVAPTVMNMAEAHAKNSVAFTSDYLLATTNRTKYGADIITSIGAATRRMDIRIMPVVAPQFCKVIDGKLTIRLDHEKWVRHCKQYDLRASLPNYARFVVCDDNSPEIMPLADIYERNGTTTTDIDDSAYMIDTATNLNVFYPDKSYSFDDIVDMAVKLHHVREFQFSETVTVTYDDFADWLGKPKLQSDDQVPTTSSTLTPEELQTKCQQLNKLLAELRLGAQDEKETDEHMAYRTKAMEETYEELKQVENLLQVDTTISSQVGAGNSEHAQCWMSSTSSWYENIRGGIDKVLDKLKCVYPSSAIAWTQEKTMRVYRQLKMAVTESKYYKKISQYIPIAYGINKLKDLFCGFANVVRTTMQKIHDKCVEYKLYWIFSIISSAVSTYYIWDYMTGQKNQVQRVLLEARAPEMERQKSKPDDVRRAAQYARPGRSEPQADSEAISNQHIYDQMLKIQENVGIVQAISNGTQHSAARFVAVCNDTILVPKHFYKVAIRKSPDDDGVRQLRLKWGNKVILTLLDNIKVAHIGDTYDFDDTTLIKFNDITLSCRNIVGCFCSEKAFPSAVKGQLVVPTLHKASNIVVPFVQNVDIITQTQYLEDSGDLISDWDMSPVHTGKALVGWNYVGTTVSGDCGSVLCDTTSGKSGIIIGLHSVGAARSSYSGMISREWLEKALASLGVVAAETQMDTWPVYEGKFRRPGMIAASRVDNDKRVHIPTNSNIIPSDFQHVSGVEPIRIPVSLKPGTAVQRLNHISKKWKVYDDVTLVSTMHRLAEHFYIRYFDKPVIPTLTEHQILNGFDTLGGINMSAACGYPYCLKKKTKLDFFKYDSVNMRYITTDRSIWDDVDTLQHDIETGQVIDTCWLDYYKDETKDRAQVAAGKIRVFSACPLSLLLLVRKYFGGMIEQLHNHMFTSGICTGIDPCSDAWTILARRLLSKNNKMLAGDYKNYDGTLPASVLNAFIKVVQLIYKEDETGIRSKILYHILQMPHQLGAVRYKTLLQNPSGNPLTTELNSICNVILIQWALLASTPDKIHIENIIGDTTLAIYGDDNIISTQFSFDLKDFVDAFTSIGMTYTATDKTANVQLQTLDKISFLGRLFEKRDGIYYAPLDIHVIINSLCWTRIAIPKDDIEHNISQQILELKQHDPRDISHELNIIVKTILILQKSPYDYVVQIPSFFVPQFIRIMQPQLQADRQEVRDGDTSVVTTPSINRSRLYNFGTQAKSRTVSDIMEVEEIVSTRTNSRAWTTQNSVHDTICRIQLPAEMASVTQYKYKMSYNLLLRCKFVFRIMHNGTRFQQGLAIAYWLPVCSVGMPDNLDVTAYGATAMNHVLIQPGLKEVVLEVPFAYHKTSYNIGCVLPNDEFGDLFIRVLTPLRSPGAGEIHLVVRMSMQDVELTGPSCLEPNTNQISITSSFGPQLQSDEQQSKTTEGVISGPLDTVNNIAKLVGKIPIFNTVAGYISTVASTTASIARVIGLSKPTTIGTTNRVIPHIYTGVTLADGLDNSQKLAMSPVNAVRISPEIFGNNIDMMSLEALCKTPTMIGSKTWKKGDGRGDSIFSLPVTPTIFSSEQADIANTFRYQTSLLGYIALGYRYWRGPIQFEIQVVCSEFHTGSLIAYFVPCGNKEAYNETPALTKISHKRFDLGGKDTFITSFGFTIEFLSERLYKCNNGLLRSINYNDDITGTINIDVLVPLNCPDTVSSTVDVALWISAGDGFHLVKPCVDNIQSIRYVCAHRATNGNPAVMQMLEPRKSQRESQLGKQWEALPMISKVASVSDYVMGEETHSLRDILKVFSRRVSCEVRSVRGSRQVAYFPIYFFRSGDGTDDFAPSDTFLDHYLRVFRFSRGSFRHKWVFNTCNARVSIYVVEPRHDMAFNTFMPLPEYITFEGNPWATTQLVINPTIEYEIPYYNQDICTVHAADMHTRILALEVDFLDNNPTVVNGVMHEAIGDDFSAGSLVGPPQCEPRENFIGLYSTMLNLWGQAKTPRYLSRYHDADGAIHLSSYKDFARCDASSRPDNTDISPVIGVSFADRNFSVSGEDNDVDGRWQVGIYFLTVDLSRYNLSYVKVCTTEETTGSLDGEIIYIIIHDGRYTKRTDLQKGPAFVLDFGLDRALGLGAMMKMTYSNGHVLHEMIHTNDTNITIQAIDVKLSRYPSRLKLEYNRHVRSHMTGATAFYNSLDTAFVAV